VTEEIKKLIEEQARTFEAFKATVDGIAAEQEKYGGETAETKEALDKINKELDRLGAGIKKGDARADAAEAKANRERLGGVGLGADADAERKHVEAFNLQARLSAQLKGRMPPAPVDVDGFRAYKQAFGRWARGGEAMLEDAAARPCR